MQHAKNAVASAVVGVALAAGGIDTGGTSAAVAADLGSPRVVRPPEDFRPPYAGPLEIERWTGFYFGGTLGGLWGEARTDGDIGRWPFHQDGTVGTIFAGYNWQLGRTVLGVETDIGTGRVSGSASTDLGILRSELNSFGSFRGRVGFLASPSLLFYGTAGLAWSSMDFSLAGLDTASKTLWGYQVGLGAELMISHHVGLRFEYLYTDLEKTDFTHSGLRSTYDPDSHTLRAGISFKF